MGSLHLSEVRSSVQGRGGGGGDLWDGGWRRAPGSPPAAPPPRIRDFSLLWPRDCGGGWRREPADPQASPGPGAGSAGHGPAKAAGAEGQRRGSWLTVSHTQDEAAAPGGHALRRDPGRGAPSAGPAQGKRWARLGRTPSRTLHFVTRGCTGPPSGMPRNTTPRAGLLTFLGLPKRSATRAASPKRHPSLFRPKR